MNNDTNTAIAIATYIETTEALRKQAEELTRSANLARENLEKILASEAWRKFDFFSSYYGGHGELGEGDEEIIFYFHPSVDLSSWVEVVFSHGHRGQSESRAEFFGWLSRLGEGLYVELD